MDEKFCTCFVMKLAPQRGEGEERERVQISEQRLQNLLPKKYLDLCSMKWICICKNIYKKPVIWALLCHLIVLVFNAFKYT